MALYILLFASVPLFKPVQAYQNPKKLYDKRGKIPAI